jgi:hypothetical protein
MAMTERRDRMEPASVLAPLLDLPDVSDVLAQARSSVDAALRQRDLLRPATALVDEVALHAAVASAALEGHPYPVDEVRGGTVTDPVVQGSLRAAAGLRGLVGVWRVAPRQALARLHLLAARGCPGVDEAGLGRPVAAGAILTRLDQLLDIVVEPSRGIPALLRSAVVHGELLALRPFAGPSGVVARAAARLVLVADGFDPNALLPLDVGHAAREPEYVGTANAFSTGTRDGVRSWLRHCATATGVATDELMALATRKPTALR